MGGVHEFLQTICREAFLQLLAVGVRKANGQSRDPQIQACLQQRPLTWSHIHHRTDVEAGHHVVEEAGGQPCARKH